MQMLLAVSRAIDRINEFIGKSVMWLILVAVLVSAVRHRVVARTARNRPAAMRRVTGWL